LNRAGKKEIGHFVLFEGKQSHVAEHIHGVFHADLQSVKEKLEAEHLERLADEALGGGSKGKPRGKKAGKEKAGKPIETYVKGQLNFVAQLTDRVVIEGSKVKLSAFVAGKDPQVKWYKNNIPMVFGPKVKNLSSDGVCVLEIHNATIDDSAEYKVAAKNPAGEVTSVCRLTVYKSNASNDMAPMFTRSLKGKY